MIKAILASTKEGIIGYQNNLPWKNIPKDMKFFSEQTNNSILIFGFNTFRNLSNKIHLNKQNRAFYILSKDKIHPNKFIDNQFNSISDLKEFLVTYNGKKDIYLCGGKFVYENFINYANEVYLTTVNNKLLNQTEDLVKLDLNNLLKDFKTNELIYKDKDIQIYQYKK
ncbi:dihydrofolate reductase [Mycoplasmopsis edwardii]|uniref:Dihydrofolate reductase n=1 Tax=Mycoplasmopsis edwardii TaxID=53558 RepID=A0ACD4PIH2_9BACT|nr:dihydrofolate reductase [Mycoplasmopsis edwardii]WBP83783.1 dihydrofolate reductase [Mycoplasmopsis edwardii]